MKKLSIIRVVFTFYPIKGGSVTHIMELSKKINLYLVDQVIIAPKFNGDYQEFDTSFKVKVVRIEYTKFKFLEKLNFPVVPFVLFDYTYRVAKFIRFQFQPKDEKVILHVHDELLGAFIILLKKLFNIPYPVVIMQHGNPKERSYRSRVSIKIAHIMLRFLKPHYYLLLDDGTDINDYIEWLKKYSIPYSVVYHGIDTSYFHPSNKKSKDFVVLSNHRLEPVKRIDIAIEAFAKFLELVNYKKDIKLIIVGSGSCEEVLKQLVIKKKLERWIDFVGEKSVEEVKELIQMSDVVVGTSLESNLNRAIQEAMACGKPVIVFNSGGTSKLIKHLDNGILVEPGNIDKFAEWLKKLYENPKLRIKIGKNARASIEKYRSWNIRVRKELSVYERVLKSFD